MPAKIKRTLEQIKEEESKSDKADRLFSDKFNAFMKIQNEILRKKLPKPKPKKSKKK